MYAFGFLVSVTALVAPIMADPQAATTGQVSSCTLAGGGAGVCNFSGRSLPCNEGLACPSEGAFCSTARGDGTADCVAGAAFKRGVEFMA